MLRNSWVWSFAKSFSMLLRRLAAYESSMAPFIATLISRHFDPSQVAEESRAQWIGPSGLHPAMSSAWYHQCINPEWDRMIILLVQAVCQTLQPLQLASRQLICSIVP